MNMVLHLRVDIDQLCVWRKEGGRERAITEDSIGAAKLRPKDISKSKEKRIAEAFNYTADV